MHKGSHGGIDTKYACVNKTHHIIWRGNVLTPGCAEALSFLETAGGGVIHK